MTTSENNFSRFDKFLNRLIISNMCWIDIIKSIFEKFEYERH